MKTNIKHTIIELIRSSKDYSSFSLDELKLQYDIIISQYDDFKNKMLSNIEHKFTISKLEDIKRKQINIQEKMHKKALIELDERLSIIKNLIDNN